MPFHRAGSRSKWGARDALYMTNLRLTTRVLSTISNTDPPSATSRSATSCEAPAQTRSAMPSDAADGKPTSEATMPQTIPKGTTPNRSGAMALAPDAMSARPVAPLRAETPPGS